MTNLLNLPMFDGKKFLVVDEGVDATYAEDLIIAWLKAIRKKGSGHPIHFLLFSSPKYKLQRCLKGLDLSDYQVKDYFSVNKENEFVYENLTNFVTQNLNSTFVINCINTLALQIGVVKACRFLEKLAQHRKARVFCIYRRDFHQNIPRIESLGNIYVKINKSKKFAFESKNHYEVNIVHKKPGGSVTHWNELVEQNVENYDLVSEKIPDIIDLQKEINKLPNNVVKPQASFRIEMSEKEIKQRDSVPLPYILPGNPGGESKIIYVPDDVDDLDEEDPDDDLDI